MQRALRRQRELRARELRRAGGRPLPNRSGLQSGHVRARQRWGDLQRRAALPTFRSHLRVGKRRRRLRTRSRGQRKRAVDDCSAHELHGDPRLRSGTPLLHERARQQHELPRQLRRRKQSGAVRARCGLPGGRLDEAALCAAERR